jgi:hypothetical protein
VHAAEQDRLNILKRRRDWSESQPNLDPDRLVFINGLRHCLGGGSMKMARTHGRARCSRRLRASIPHGHWKTTFVAGLRNSGMIAPMVLDGRSTALPSKLMLTRCWCLN